MTIPITVQKVKLPREFQVNKRDQNGTIVFEFSSPVALPYSNESLQQYCKASQDNKDFFFGPSLKHEDLTALSYAVIQATLPEFTGENGFYQAGFNASEMYGLGMLENGKMTLSHVEDRKLRAGLHLTLHSDGRFFPVLNKETAERPTIDKGTVTGSVHLSVNIPHSQSKGYIYYSEVSAAIVASLAHNQLLTLKEDPLVKSEYGGQSSGVYVHVDNPTLKRMQAVLSKEKALAAYFAKHIEPIKAAAEIFTEAQRLNNNYRKKIVSEHQKLLCQVDIARRELDPEIPVPVSIDETVARIETHINAKLREATDKIAHLSAGFPTGIFQYATTQSSPR